MNSRAAGLIGAAVAQVLAWLAHGRSIVAWLACIALAAIAGAESAAEFMPVPPNPLMGDWAGSVAPVAQVFKAEGGWRANLLREFDQPGDRPIAILEGRERDGRMVWSGDGWSGTMAGGQFTLSRGEDPITLARVARPSPTLGTAPPPGAIVLFDGSGIEAWATKSGKDWLKPAGPAAWKLVPGGAMEIVPGADSLISREWFGDACVHLEFRTLGAPTNSGVYVQARYEVNINETYGRLDANPCAGLDNAAEMKPRLRAARPPLEWQTLDIDFVAPRFDAAGAKIAVATATVLLNGICVYDRQPLNPPKGAAGRLGEAARGPLLLQEHGQPVQFRNIWVLEGRRAADERLEAAGERASQ